MRRTARSLTLTGEVFQVVLEDSQRYRASELRLTSKPVIVELQPQPLSSRLAGRIRGQKIEIPMQSEDGRLG